MTSTVVAIELTLGVFPCQLVCAAYYDCYNNKKEFYKYKRQTFISYNQ
jgi:hypothetical protein